MSNKSEDYYIGLDCGTSSVGWAVTDNEYNLLRAKGKTLWGVRLFDEAKTAADRRVARSARRRVRRTSERIKLLNLLFDNEMAKIDPEFYLRLKKSFLLEEDKSRYLKRNSKNTLFNDPNFTDKDFHSKYPTIWHLRKTIIESPENEHFDLRLYYLAIHHILKNRGHFLRPEKTLKGAGDFSPIFQEFCEIADIFNIRVADCVEESLKAIITNRSLGVRDKAKQIKESIFIESDDYEGKDKRPAELATLIAGGTASPLTIFDLDEESEKTKLSFAANNLEEKIAEVEGLLDAEQFSLIETAKKIYDYGFLSELLNGEDSISSAMVKNYDLHQMQLKELKRLLKPFPSDYNTFFKTTETSSPCYNAYIGKSFTKDKNGRKKSFSIDQETINKEILRLLKDNNIETPLFKLAERKQLLPKQKGQAKGTIPQQLHHNELEIILAHLEKDYPAFAKKNSDEPEEYNTISKKISHIHSFRIPYYCGPLKKEGKWAWAKDAEVNALVRPWNFHLLVDRSAHANDLIKRMTNKCTYLPEEDVLPKSSLLYQKYMVLNELNNLKINGIRLDCKTKQIIYEKVFEAEEKHSGISGNITIKNLEKWLRNNGILGKDDELSGSAETKFLPRLSTHHDFQKIFGANYGKTFSIDKLEEVINLITVLNNEPEMIREKIREVLGDNKCSDEQLKKLAKKSYNGWGRLSQKFLANFPVEIEGKNKTLIEMLWETNENLMELLSNKYSFRESLENNFKPQSNITYKDVENLYCSPAVKRSIWQAIKIIDELVKVKGDAPKKIFLESTREDDEKKKGKATPNRKERLIEIYKTIKNSPEIAELLKELEGKDPHSLRGKKLYLYFTQMGRCAYSGERINLEELATDAYDIDHIYPRSKTKDDSITRNLVLVKKEYNIKKGDEYPIYSDWRDRMRGYWGYWFKNGLITEEKYHRLTRSTKLTAEELSKFIARQIVETSQSVKALRGLLVQKYPDTKIVLVKAGQVHDLRNYFANGYKDKETGTVKVPPRPEFVKVRSLNDFHHAKDAYLNIVVGNVMSETFTDNPYKWLSKPENREHYSINSHNIWRSKPLKNNFIKAWNYADSIKIISDNMSKNNILWTRMTHTQTGAISDLQPVGKSENTSGILPLKKNLDPAKYGGYNSLKGAHFSLIEFQNNKHETIRKIIQIPILSKERPETYLKKEYPSALFIIPNIPIDSLFKINNDFLHISGRTGNSLIFAPAHQVYLAPEHSAYLEKVCKANEKLSKIKDYIIDEEKDKVNPAENIKIYNILVDKLRLLKNIQGLGHRVNQLAERKTNFSNLSVKDQCLALEKILIAFGCSTSTTDLNLLLPSAISVGKSTTPNIITNFDSAYLIHQSPTGLFERKINLKTCPPQKLNTKNSDLGKDI